MVCSLELTINHKQQTTINYVKAVSKSKIITKTISSTNSVDEVDTIAYTSI